MSERTCMVSGKPAYMFYAQVRDDLGHTYYFKGNYRNSDDFKNKIKSYYAVEIDAVCAYNLHFDRLSNVSKLSDVSDDQYIVV